MASVERMQRNHQEDSLLKRKNLASSFSQEEAIHMEKKNKKKKKKKKQLLMKESLEETTKKKRKERNANEAENQETKEEEWKKGKKEDKNKPFGRIVDDEPQLNESAHYQRDVSFRLLVPSTEIGKVIGPHGSRIQQLRSHTGAHIKIGDAIMNLSERLIWISSKEDSLESQSVAERALLSVASLLVEPSNEGEETCKIRLLIAGSQENSVTHEAEVAIGKISETTGTNVEVFRKKMFPLLAFAAETDRLVQFEGKFSGVLKALELIAARLRGSPPRRTGTNGCKNVGAFKASVDIRIPNDLTAKLIGKNGATIRQLKQQCGVFLQLDDLKEGANDRTVHLKGTLSQVTMAQTLLQVFLSSKRRVR